MIKIDNNIFSQPLRVNLIKLYLHMEKWDLFMTSSNKMQMLILLKYSKEISKEQLLNNAGLNDKLISTINDYTTYFSIKINWIN